MTNERRVLIHPDKASLSGSVAARFITKIIDLLEDRDAVNVVLTGGSVGTAVLAAINASPARDSVDWKRVSFWWGDERFVARDDADRNELQARRALLDHADIDEAAAVYALELLEAGDGNDYPTFDITFLGVGPDGHIASLFPGQDAVRVTNATVVAVRESPKPPPKRLSLTLPVIRSSERIWLVLAGSDKASALGLALAGASIDEVPVAGAEGRRRTVFFVDKDAASEVPEYLITPTYY
jgi:6-phosphogluconolactonase